MRWVDHNIHVGRLEHKVTGNCRAVESQGGPLGYRAKGGPRSYPAKFLNDIY